MTIGSILLAVALFLIVGLFVFRPIIASTRIQSARSRKETLLSEKDILIAQIRSLDFDLETGTIDEQAHAIESERLKYEAADKLRQVDELPDDDSADVDAQIEAAIAALRHTDATCSKCGKPVSSDDSFCRSCGESL